MTYSYVIIYNDGYQASGTIGASSRAEAEAKVRATASCSAGAHRGVRSIRIS